MKIVSTYDHVETDTRVYVLDNGDCIPFGLAHEKARGLSDADETANTQQILDNFGMIFAIAPKDDGVLRRILAEGEKVWQIATQ